MFQQNEIKTLGNRTIPILRERMFFYIYMDDILTNSESRSIQPQKFEKIEVLTDCQHKDDIGIILMTKLCEYQYKVIDEQTKQIETLNNYLADYEEEIYQKEFITQIEKQQNVSEEKTYDD